MISSLSIIFPFFNEDKRIPETLIKIDNFIKKNFFDSLEIIFVDDGSTDTSSKIVRRFLKIKLNNNVMFKLIILKKNFGKGYALKRGVEIASNKWVLTCDIDLSVDLNQIFFWNKKFINKNSLIYFGSRELKKSKVKKDFIRFLLGIAFQKLINFFFKIYLTDTQCGFKLYEKNCAKKIFSRLKERGFIHDVEIVLLCKSLNFTIKELPIKWLHKSDGKVNLFVEPIRMLKDLFFLFIRKIN